MDPAAHDFDPTKFGFPPPLTRAQGLARRKAEETRSGSVRPPSASVLRASAWAHSTKIGSFKDTRACKGEFERRRRTQDMSALGTSKVCKAG